MCGICGFNFEDRELLRNMMFVLEHRGPDGQGHYIDENISLGHRRLSIIDLSLAGKQPMCNEDENVWIIFNGEIYNFKELRKELEQKGHRFKSNCDTEVIIHGYEQWGEEVVQKLNGQFAFAIWDARVEIGKNKLFMARDRLGIIPLYYHWDETDRENPRLSFASEIKALLLNQNVRRKINQTAAYKYLNLRYIPGEETLFEGIKKLLPGHTLVMQDKKITIRPFWVIPMPASEYKKGLQNEQATEVYNQLYNSVKKRLVADVPVGVYLSGGIDSASIVALASAVKKEQDEDEAVKTFTVGFNYDNTVDELDQARQVSEHFNTAHQEITIDSPISGIMPKILWHLDMPHGDPVVIPQFKLSELAVKDVKVVLSGEGADEVYGGYVQYGTMMKTDKIRKMPSLILKNAAKIIPISVLDSQFNYPSSVGEKGKEKFADFIAEKDEGKAYIELVSIMSSKDRDKINIQNKKLGENQHYKQEIKPLVNRMLYYDMKTWLPNYVLHINDRMTMSHSVEGRVPFLDHPVVESSMNLPVQLKRDKKILRQAMKQLLPMQTVQGAKHPFFMPLDRWYKEELYDLAEQLFKPASVRERGWFDYYHLRKIWDDYEKSKLIYGKQLFTVLNFELWQRMFIDPDKITINSRKIKLSQLI